MKTDTPWMVGGTIFCLIFLSGIVLEVFGNITKEQLKQFIELSLLPGVGGAIYSLILHWMRQPLSKKRGPTILH